MYMRQDLGYIRGTIDSYLSAFVDWLHILQSPLTSLVRTPATARLLEAFSQHDIDTQGLLPANQKIPISAIFVQLTVDRIQTHFASQPSLSLLYQAALVLMYMGGGRVYEVLVGSEELTTSPHTGRPHRTHSYRVSSPRFNYVNPEVILDFSAPDDLAAIGFPSPSCTIQPQSTKNHQAGAPPQTLFANPREPGMVSFCICDLLYKLACSDRYRHPSAMTDYLFQDVSATVLLHILRLVAADYDIDPSRVVLSGLRVGCASATTSTQDIEQAAVSLGQAYQGWRTPGGMSPYRRANTSTGLVKSYLLYCSTINSMVQLKAQFCPDYIHSAESLRAVQSRGSLLAACRKTF
jgi:hypothetical protein